jgi:hypothetical protein|tara:strand:- start:673 stop:1593 length:921 start_codon:yes stop_codon:yes gene_type:complete
MKTLTEQYRLIKEDKGHKGVFLKEAKKQFPNLLKNNSTFKEVTTILKQKNIISENFVGTPMVGNPLERNKESYETAFENFLAEAEAKAEEKKVTKEVEEDLSKNYNYSKEAGKSNPDTMIYGQIQMGVYYEAKQEKNADKTLEEIKDIVYKNLDKDSIYYTKNGQFGVDVGYTDDNVALGEPVEPKGPHKSSGYGNLNEVAIAGGLVTGGGFTSQNYMDFYGLHEEDTNEATDQEVENQKELNKELEKTAALQKDTMEEDMQDVGGYKMTYMEELADAAEQAYDAGMDIDEIAEFVVQHLGLKMGE